MQDTREVQPMGGAAFQPGLRNAWEEHQRQQRAVPDQFPRLGSRSHIFLSLRLPLWARCHAVSRYFGVSLAWGSRAVARGRLTPWDMIPRVRPPAARRRGQRHVRQATSSAWGWGIGAALPWKHVERARLDTRPNVLPGELAASSLSRSRLPLWTRSYHTLRCLGASSRPAAPRMRICTGVGALQQRSL